MDLINFLKWVDERSAQISEEQFRVFIHDIARTLPEKGRDDFLRRLRLSGKDKAPADEKGRNLQFQKSFQRIRENLKQIDSQEITIASELNEEYDDWYNSGAEELFYEDEAGVGDMLAEACALVHTCMDEEMYQAGFVIGKQLFSMEILCDSEYGCMEFSIRDMVYYDLLQWDLHEMALDNIMWCREKNGWKSCINCL